MNVVEINYTDLSGSVFDGYDLMEYLRARGHDVHQIVRWKQSDNPKVIKVGYDWIVHEQIHELERRHRVSNVWFPYGSRIMDLDIVKKADILHFHILHNEFVSLLDYPMLFSEKRVVWTIHDPWIFTGGCIHPLACEGWKEGCTQCKGPSRFIYNTDDYRTEELKQIKDEIWEKISPEIVVSSTFMMKFFVHNSLTTHLENKIHMIPFGINCSVYPEAWLEKKKKRLSEGEKVAIGFRTAGGDIKGYQYIYEALKKYDLSEKVRLVTTI